MPKNTRGRTLADEIGRRVRALRTQARVTQEKLGEMAELHRTYIGHLERGEVNPSLLNVVRVADALGVNPAALVDGLTLKDGGE